MCEIGWEGGMRKDCSGKCVGELMVRVVLVRVTGGGEEERKMRKCYFIVKPKDIFHVFIFMMKNKMNFFHLLHIYYKLFYFLCCCCHFYFHFRIGCGFYIQRGAAAETQSTARILSWGIEFSSHFVFL